VPVALLAERSAGARAKLLYGLLQTVPGCRGRSGQFTYTALSSLTQLDRNTLELDRFYEPLLAFEFNGAQHYRTTGRYTQAEADAQHFRDLIKAGICLYRGIHLVVIHPEDLSLQGLIKKIGGSAPLRSLDGQEPIIDLLETASLCYIASARGQGPREAT